MGLDKKKKSANLHSGKAPRPGAGKKRKEDKDQMKAKISTLLPAFALVLAGAALWATENRTALPKSSVSPSWATPCSCSLQPLVQEEQPSKPSPKVAIRDEFRDSECRLLWGSGYACFATPHSQCSMWVVKLDDGSWQMYCA
ncbi:MAG: hypothetical protein ACOY7U_03140 [Acidobacteriota bacterium]